MLEDDELEQLQDGIDRLELEGNNSAEGSDGAEGSHSDGGESDAGLVTMDDVINDDELAILSPPRSLTNNRIKGKIVAFCFGQEQGGWSRGRIVRRHHAGM